MNIKDIEYFNLECYCIDSLVTVVIQSIELGYCKDENGKYLDTDTDNAEDLTGSLTGVDNKKETCLNQCLRVEGVRGCEFISDLNFCYASKVKVTTGDGARDGTCWIFQGKSQCGQKSELS